MTSIGLFARFRSDAITRTDRRIEVVLSQCLAFLRAKELRSLFHGLFHNNEATHEATME